MHTNDNSEHQVQIGMCDPRTMQDSEGASAYPFQPSNNPHGQVEEDHHTPSTSTSNTSRLSPRTGPELIRTTILSDEDLLHQLARCFGGLPMPCGAFIPRTPSPAVLKAQGRDASYLSKASGPERFRRVKARVRREGRWEG